MRSELELYARGLALADGTVSGRNRNSVHYHMHQEARGVLEQIAILGSKNGVRELKEGRWTRVHLTVRGKPWWKTSIEGLDDIHAFRGYVEGDGCWTAKNRRRHRREHDKSFYPYFYPKAVIFVNMKEFFLVPWVEACLEGFRFSKYVVAVKTSSLLRYEVLGGEAVRLAEKLYENSTVGFKCPNWG